MGKIFLILALLPLSITGCSEKGQESSRPQPAAFFDLKGYMQNEARRLSETQPLAVKRIAINGKTEEKTFEVLDYEKELAVFSRSDINRVAWLDKYKADSVFLNGQLSQITYTAMDQGLKTQLLDIRFSDGQVAQIQIKNRAESIVADVGQEMWYSPGSGYSLESGQSTALTKENKVRVEVAFPK